MIVFLTLIWIALIFLLAKLNVITLNLWWKLSPAIWMCLLVIVLFIPMQFWAPGGPVIGIQYSVPIIPNVTGEVTQVLVEPNKPIKKGDTLFTIDPEPYIAARDQILADLELATMRLADSEQLLKKKAIAEYDVDQYRAQVKKLSASLKSAEYNLTETVVTAPADGFVTNVGLRPGYRAASFPFAPAMTFVEESRRVLAAQIFQGHLRLVEPGQEAEVTFKMLPGKVFPATVEYIIPALASGQVGPNANMVAPREIVAAPYVVRLHLNDESLMYKIPSGAAGTAAIYTNSGKPTHIIRKVMIRMDAYMNYIVPF